MNVESIIGLLVAAIIGGLISGGGIAALGYRGLLQKITVDLGPTFATVARAEGIEKDVNNVGTRVNALETVAIMAKDTADQNSDRIIRLEEATNAERTALSRTLVRMDETLRDMDRRAQQQQTEITRTVTLISELEKRMDRHAPHD